METANDRLALARLSLEGLSVGDALGGFFEMSSPNQPSHFVTNRQLPSGQWRFTDDTNMALSIYSTLRIHKHVEQDALAKSFIAHYDRSRGYGRGMRALIARIKKGQNWREASQSFYGGNGSYGNGGAMRVAPIGAYFADNISAVVANAHVSAEITHSHPEGVAGAITVAVAASIAFLFRQLPEASPQELMEQVIQHIPESEVRRNCETAAKLEQDTTVLEAVEQLGNGMDISAQRTVPLVLWLASKYRHDYEEAIWQTLSAGGDADTNCAMVGGIVALSAIDKPIPSEWIDKREPLPSWAFS